MTEKINPRVLMIGPSLESRGGMATVEKQLTEHLPDMGVQVRFISTYNDCDKLGKLTIALAAYLQFCVALNNVDIVHVHMASRGSYRRKRVFISAASHKGIPIVLHLHAAEFALWFDDECSEKEKRDIRNTFNRCAKIVVLSEEWKDFLISRGVCSPERISVVHNAVNLPPKNMTDYSCNAVLFMGRLDARKSPDVLLRAAARLLPRHPQAQFVFGGDGDVAVYEQLARELGILDHCSFVGWVKAEDKEDMFHRCSIYCLPSKNEGMPMSVLEAMSYGLATVSTPVGGIPQVISDGVDGFLFPVDDVIALGRKLDQLMSDRDLKERVGKKGRSRIEDVFSLEGFLCQIRLVYGEICR